MATAAVVLLGLAAQPAKAAGAFAGAGRAYELSGDRHGLRIDGKITDPAGQSGLGIALSWGADPETSSTLHVGLIQGDGGAGTRALHLSGYGTFKAVDGHRCRFDPGDSGYGRLTCDRPGYDWVRGRTYRLIVTRGDANDRGRRWVISLVDRATSARIKVISFRSPFGRMADGTVSGNVTNIADCDNINSFQAVVNKPVGDDGTTVAWGATDNSTTCFGGATMSAPLSSGKVTLNVS